MNFICLRRLKWPLPDTTTTTTTMNTTASNSTGNTADSSPVQPFTNPIPFADSDYKILRNDWPYGVAPGITHLVVWLRTPVPVKEDGGDLTEESRALIEGFVQRTFVARLASTGRFEDPEAHVLWFKNWSALQSVRALEHVHVLVRDVPVEILLEWTGNDNE